MLRLLHIRKEDSPPGTSTTYTVIDNGRHGEKSGFGESCAFTREALTSLLSQEGLPSSAIEDALGELDETGSAQIELQPRIGPRIIRAWFDTVLNPLLQSLELELKILQKRNLTFSFRPEKFELIRPIRRLLEYSVWPNLEQIEELNPALKEAFQRHDKDVDRLLDAVIALHTALSTDPEFTKLCDSLLTPEQFEELGATEHYEVFGAYPPSDRYNLIAQYVVNNPDQPAYYSTAKFWNRNREILLATLQFPGVRKRYLVTIQMADQSASDNRELIRTLKDLRRDLSFGHDVPLTTGDENKPAA